MLNVRITLFANTGISSRSLGRAGLPLKLPPRPKLRLEIPILRMMLSKHEDSQLFEDTDHELITINGLNIYCNYYVKLIKKDINV